MVRHGTAEGRTGANGLVIAAGWRNSTVSRGAALPTDGCVTGP
jgi:hypothetical protein